jgi:segregation and condensation protein A
MAGGEQDRPDPAGADAAAGSAGVRALAQDLGWGEDERSADEILLIDLEGFEGPLDLLLALARTQKVDLARISILKLTEQYLAFIDEARHLRLELAADYLVMAAWLAFLKSRLLLPRDETAGDEATPEELAARLHFRLQRLAAMREAAAKLFTRQRLGRDVFPRGMPEGARTIREKRFSAGLYDLLKAYADQRKRGTVKTAHVVRRRVVWSIKEARMRLERLVGPGAVGGGWVQLDLFLEAYLPSAEVSRTALASSFGATLEMAREGLIELRQDGAFAPIFMRGRTAERG